MSSSRRALTGSSGRERGASRPDLIPPCRSVSPRAVAVEKGVASGRHPSSSPGPRDAPETATLSDRPLDAVQRCEGVWMRTLVLNAGYEPLAVVSFKRAMVLVMAGKAAVLEIDAGHPVLSAAGAWDRPSVIVLTRYVRVPYGRSVPVSRRGVLRRDEHRCAYCSAHATTIDHVVPRSRGGADTWENLVACCLGCNNAKGDRTPSEMGWRLTSIPRMPFDSAWLVRGTERPAPVWSTYLTAA